jgi:hypothetical protein
VAGEGVKDFWDKLQIVLQPLGGLLTAVAIAFFGFFTSSFLNRRQAMETNTRLYSELMSRREESESALRKDMFVSIINTFVTADKSDLGTQVLNLELLAYNFHESLNLKPLFIDLKKRIEKDRETATTGEDIARCDEYRQRLESVAREITKKQIIVLEGAGKKADRTIDLSGDPTGTSLEPVTLELDSIATTFSIDVKDVDRSMREVEIEMMVETPDPHGGRQMRTVTFWVSFYDFPVIDNTRLARGQRCSVVLNSFTDHAADITLVLFPGTYASLKEKPYYSEVIENVLKASRSLAE